MKIGDVFKPTNGGDQYACIVAFPERNVSVTGKPLAKPAQDVGYKLRRNNRGRWSTKIYQMPKRSFKLEFTALALVLALLPGIVFAQFAGYSQWDPALGGYRYYSAPNAGYDNAMATQNFLGAMRMIQQQRQFNRQMELMQQEMDRRDRELQHRYYRPQSTGVSTHKGLKAVWIGEEHYETPEGQIEELPPETMPRWQQAKPVDLVETGYPSHLIAE